MFFWNSLAFSMIQRMLAIWSLVPLPFLETSLNIWKFTFHVLLKPGLENFEHYFTSVWDECNCAVVWAYLALPFFGIEMKTDIFQSCGHCWVFQICWHFECSTFTALSFRIWNSSTGIPSPPLALFVVMLPKAHLTSHSRMSGSRWVLVITPSWLSETWNSFCTVLLCILATSSWYLLLLLGPYHFCPLLSPNKWYMVFIFLKKTFYFILAYSWLTMLW